MYRILIVDDHPRVRDSLAILLADMGDVRTAADGREALLALESFQADVVVLDLHMPVMNGREFASCYRRWAEPRAAILLLSADGEVERIAHELAADRWLAKGAQPDVLRSEVAALARNRRASTRG